MPRGFACSTTHCESAARATWRVAPALRATVTVVAVPSAARVRWS